MSTITVLLADDHDIVREGLRTFLNREDGIKVVGEAEAITLTVKDDGCGITALDPQQHGMGLRIMHYRTDMIGARVSIVKQPAGGTCLTCTLPMQPSVVSAPTVEKSKQRGASKRSPTPAH